MNKGWRWIFCDRPGPGDQRFAAHVSVFSQKLKVSVAFHPRHLVAGARGVFVSLSEDFGQPGTDADGKPEFDGGNPNPVDDDDGKPDLPGPFHFDGIADRGQMKATDAGAGPNFGLACNADFTNTLPQADYQDLKVTAAFRTDTPARVVGMRPGLKDGDRIRTKKIVLNDLDVWYAAPGTVVDVDAKGELATYPGGYLRDDRKYLRWALAFAMAWYCRPRASVQFTIKRAEQLVELGALLKSATVGGEQKVVGTPVTAIHVDCRKGWTTYTTNSGELDLAAWAGSR